MIQIFGKYLLIFGVILLASCSKKEEPTPPPAQVESPIFKQEIKTLHKAEQINQQTEDVIGQQRQAIDAATQE